MLQLQSHIDALTSPDANNSKPANSDSYHIQVKIWSYMKTPKQDTSVLTLAHTHTGNLLISLVLKPEAQLKWLYEFPIKVLYPAVLY